MIYQPRSIKRRRTKSEIEQLCNQIINEVQSDHPQSVRHVFYRMTDPTLPEPVDKTDKGYRHVQYLMTKLRRQGRIPYGWVTDATRRGYHTNTFDSPGDFISRMAGLYRGNLWRDADHYVEVWCESRSIAGVIEGTCEELAVSLYPAGGFSSITLAYQAAEYINNATGSGEKPAEIIYIGDYDPAGVLIDQSIEKELLEHLSYDVEMNFHRIAITEEQITVHSLPSKPRKQSDKRAQHIQESVEAEAMPAGLMRQLLRDSIEQFLPEGELDVIKEAEKSERQGLRSLGISLEVGNVDDIYNIAYELIGVEQ